ncbi:Protein of unknown function DUF4228 [Macleaya cordata]|uniref:Uncharacterized protein n=1 Tax=Macleaya cordata TaxID=56857 RepID=A0A200Q0I3_MACCD|nr:Protein of unknown function DUF4228 [Macleaya cordata]
MGNCQAAEAATVVIQHPGRKIERIYKSVSAKEIMTSNPGHYVALIVTSTSAKTENGTPLKQLKLLRPDDTLHMGQVYRLVSFEEVLREFAAKKCVKLGKLLKAENVRNAGEKRRGDSRRRQQPENSNSVKVYKNELYLGEYRDQNSMKIWKEIGFIMFRNSSSQKLVDFVWASQEECKRSVTFQEENFRARSILVLVFHGRPIEYLISDTGLPPKVKTLLRNRLTVVPNPQLLTQIKDHMDFTLNGNFFGASHLPLLCQEGEFLMGLGVIQISVESSLLLFGGVSKGGLDRFKPIPFLVGSYDPDSAAFCLDQGQELQKAEGAFNPTTYGRCMEVGSPQ